MKKAIFIILIFLLLGIPSLSATELPDGYIRFINEENENLLIPKNDPIAIQLFDVEGRYVGYANSFDNEMGAVFVDNTVGLVLADVYAIRVDGSDKVSTGLYSSVEVQGNIITVPISVYQYNDGNEYTGFIERMIGSDMYDLSLHIREGNFKDIKVNLFVTDVTISNPILVFTYIAYKLFFGGTLFTFIVFMLIATVVSFRQTLNKVTAMNIPILGWILRLIFIVGRTMTYRMAFHLCFIAGTFNSVSAGVLLATICVGLIILWELRVLKYTYKSTRFMIGHKALLVFATMLLILWVDRYVTPIPYAYAIAIALAVLSVVVYIVKKKHASSMNKKGREITFIMKNGESIDVE